MTPADVSMTELLRLLGADLGLVLEKELQRRVTLARDVMQDALLAFEVRYDANIGVAACAKLRAALEALR